MWWRDESNAGWDLEKLDALVVDGLELVFAEQIKRWGHLKMWPLCLKSRLVERLRVASDLSTKMAMLIHCNALYAGPLKTVQKLQVCQNMAVGSWPESSYLSHLF